MIEPLKCGFLKKSLIMNAPASCQLPISSHHFWVGLLLHPLKSDDKYAQKSVQLVRGSSFRSDFLQNSYSSYALKAQL